MPPLHVIMPVKDSLDTAIPALEALTHCPDIVLTVYDDFSSAENSATLDSLALSLGFRLVHWAGRTTHPSPNYRLTLQDAQRQALQSGSHLVIVESDVTVLPDTLQRMASQVRSGVGMVAAVTVDENGEVNFPYLYAQHMKGGNVSTRKRLSFCCTLLSNELLKAYSFELLDPEKQWYDVSISHRSLQLGLTNLLMLDNAVVHRPHSSRPWKRLKYTNPLLYYWQKLTRKRDRI